VLATPTCQILPPGVAGYRRYCPYTAGADDDAWHAPDPARARRLVAASGTRGGRITVWGWTDDPTISEGVVRYVGGVLRRLGYRVQVRLVTHASLQHPPAEVYRSIQIIAAGWGDTPYGFVATWFACGGANTHGWFCDPTIDRLNAQARLLQATNSHAATSIWTRIDRSLVDQAAWLPMVNEGAIDFLSPHVANYESHPYLGLIVDQLRVIGR
jgi:peptide/nickel transport system substrate-binding protein